jgi:hypothetical protein
MHCGPSPPALAHGSMDFIKRQSLAFGSTARIESSEPVSLLGCLDDAGLPSALHSWCKSHPAPIRWLRRLAPAGGSTDWCSCRCVAAESGGSPESEFSRATVVSFWWGLLLRDHIDEGNMFMLALIGGERQRSPATVRRLGRCLLTVRAASGEASAPRTCAKASLSSLLASRLTNYSDRQQKTWIWWLPRVRRVLDLRPKIRTICGAIYRGFR